MRESDSRGFESHELSIVKRERSQRVGVSFVAEEDDSYDHGALVSRVHPQGLACAAGLCEGDRIVFLANTLGNAIRFKSSIDVARAVRDSVGTLHVTIERPCETEAAAPGGGGVLGWLVEVHR